MDSGLEDSSPPEAILERIAEGVVALDSDLRYTYANKRALALFGRESSELLGEYIWDCFPEAEDGKAEAAIEEAMETGESRSFERYNEDIERWWEVDVYPDSGGLTMVFEDVTDRKRREKELRRYERIVENLPVAVGENEAGADSPFVAVNEAAVEMFGAESREDLRDHTLANRYVHPDQRAEVRERLREDGHIEGEEVELETLEGEQFWAAMTATVEEIEDQTRYIGIIEDITDRKRREEQLRQLHEATHDLLAVDSPTEVAQLTSQSASEILSLQANGVHLYDEAEDGLVPVAVSETTEELLGEPPTLDDGIAWDVFQTGEPRVYDDVRQAEDVYDEETPMRSELFLPLADHGVVILSSTDIGAFDDEDLQVAKLLGNSAEMALNELERERSLRNRKQKLERAETLFANAKDGFFVVDVEEEAFRFQRLNPAYENLTGLENEQMQGQTVMEVFGADDGEAIRSKYQRCVEQRAPLDYVERLDVPEPDSFWETHIAPVVVDDTVVQIVGATRNVTDQKAYERQLEEQRNSLELLNQMVRHDIRNNLQVITSYGGLLAERVDDDDREYVEKILTNAENAVELTRTARELAGTMLQSEEQTGAVSLRGVLLGQVDEIRTSYADAAVTLEDRVPEVSVEANEMLASVFRNVIKNAIQHNDKPVPEVRISVTADDDSVRVTVADNGPGIPDDQKDDIFGKGEKGLDSEGTGIGLYLVNTLVDQYGGTVRVEDNEPEGTVVTVVLQRTD